MGRVAFEYYTCRGCGLSKSINHSKSHNVKNSMCAMCFYKQLADKKREAAKKVKEKTYLTDQHKAERWRVAPVKIHRDFESRMRESYGMFWREKVAAGAQMNLERGGLIKVARKKEARAARERCEAHGFPP